MAEYDPWEPDDDEDNGEDESSTVDKIRDGKRVYDKLKKTSSKTPSQVEGGATKAGAGVARGAAGAGGTGAGAAGAGAAGAGAAGAGAAGAGAAGAGAAAAGTGIGAGIMAALPWILIALAIIGIIVLLFAFLPCLQGKCGRTSTEASNMINDRPTIQKILAWTGNEEELIQLILTEAPAIKKNIEEIINQKKNSKDENDQKLVKYLEEIDDNLDKIIATQAGTTETRREIARKIIKSFSEIKKYIYIPSASADLNNISSKPITKIVIKTTEKRMYFYADNDVIGSAPINIGANGTVNSNQACSGDNKTPLGNFTIGAKYQGINDVYNISSRLGYEFINIDGGQNMCGKTMTQRGIGIHGEDRATEPENFPRPTWGCIRMFNKDIVIVYPYLKTGTPVEISA